MISRFLREERDLRVDTLDRLAEVLDLRLVETGRGRSRVKPARSIARETSRKQADPPDLVGGELDGPEV